MYQPRPYQAKALRAIAKTRKAGEKRALVVMASGLGKTVVAGFDIRRFLRANPGAKVLYLCHQNDILRQARQELTENIMPKKYTHGFMIGDEKDIHGVDVLYASFQTMHRHKTHFRRGEFDYIVVDESHHGPAETYLPTLKYFRPKFMLAITATPERMDQQDITKIYGEHVFSLELEVAWAEGLLTPVDYRVVTDEWQNLKVLQTPVGKLSITQLNKTIFVPKRDEEVIRIIEEKLETMPSPRVMIFSPRVEHCEHMASLMDGAVAIHSRLGQREQAERLAAFRAGEYRAVITVDMFNEGIDVPEANVVVFLRSTASRTIFLQQLGRGLRLSKGKKQVVVLDFVANCDRLMMLEELRRGVNAQLTQLRRIPTDRPMLVDTGEFEFDEVARDVLSVISNIRAGMTREMVIEKLQSLALRLGRTPTTSDLSAASVRGELPSPPTIAKMFGGSLNGAFEAAGLRVYRNVPDEVIRAEVVALASRLGYIPSRLEIDMAASQKMCATSVTIANRLGNGDFHAALDSIAFPSEYARADRRALTKERARADAIVALRKYVSSLGRVPTQRDLVEASKSDLIPSVGTLKKLLGKSVEDIFEAARIHELVRTKQDLMRDLAKLELRQFAAKLGRRPTYRESQAAYGKELSLKVRGIAHLFGNSYNNALDAAGI